MNSIQAIQRELPKTVHTLTRRLFKGGFEAFGRIKREPDKRTTEQLLENIEYYAERCPEVAQFKEELKGMNPDHLGLVSDICELANRRRTFLAPKIDIRVPEKNGKSVFQMLIEMLPKASKENPESLKLSQAVIDNTDETGAKYALCLLLGPLYERKDLAKHMKAAAPLVESVADITLSSGFTMDFSKEDAFVKGLLKFINPDVPTGRLRLISRINEAADKSKVQCAIDPFYILHSPRPSREIYENLETFKQIEKHMGNSTINLDEFVLNNVNLT